MVRYALHAASLSATSITVQFQLGFKFEFVSPKSFLFEVVSIAVEKFESAFASLNLTIRIELTNVRCEYAITEAHSWTVNNQISVRTVNSFISMQAQLKLLRCLIASVQFRRPDGMFTSSRYELMQKKIISISTNNRKKL